MDFRPYLIECYELASQSPDPSNQNGALLIDDSGKILIAGFNQIPAKSADELLAILADRNEKMKYICHAEEIVIDLAAASGVCTKGLTLVCPWASCLSCARSIIISGVKNLIVHHERMETTPDRWREDVDKALLWLSRAGVNINWYSGPILEAPKILVNGVLWQP